MDTDLIERLANLEAQLLSVKAKLENLEAMLVTRPDCPAPSWPAVVKVVAAHFRLQDNMLFAKSRFRSVVWPRQLAQYFIAEFCSLNNVEIANLWRLDHSTIHHSKEQVKAALASGQRPYAADVTSLRSQLAALFGQ